MHRGATEPKVMRDGAETPGSKKSCVADLLGLESRGLVGWSSFLQAESKNHHVDISNSEMDFLAVLCLI